MRSYPSDFTPVILTVAATLVLIVVLWCLFSWYRLRALRLCMLTGTGPQRGALRVTLEPGIREFLPLLDRAGLQVRAIVVVPTLSGSDCEPLVAEVEQLSASSSYIVRLAHRLGGAVRQRDEVAGVLAEDLLYLYRHAAAVTVVRQTAPTASTDAGDQSATLRKPVGRNGLVPVSTTAAQKEAEESVTQFKDAHRGRNNGQSS